MTKNEIVELIYNDKIVNDTINNVVHHRDYRDDLKSYIILHHLEVSDDKLIGMYNKVGFTYSIVHYICLIYNKNFKKRDGKFWKENEIKRKCSTDIENIDVISKEDVIHPEFIDEATEEIEQILRYKMPEHWARVFRLVYYEGISLRAISRFAKVSGKHADYQACTRYYHKAINIIKENLSQNIKNKYQQWK